MRSFFLCLTNNFFLLESKNLVFLDFCVVRICFLTYTFFTLRQVLSNFQRSIYTQIMYIFFMKEFNLSKLNITVRSRCLF